MKTLFYLLPLALLIPSCGTMSTGGNSGYLTAFRQAAPVTENKVPDYQKGYWDDDNIQGPASIVIIRSEQKAYFYKGEQVVGMSPISTGSSKYTTPAGRFKVSEKDIDHTSSLYGIIRDVATGQVVNDDADTRKHKPKRGQVYEGAPMAYFMRFNSGIGMHVGHLPGYAASHGCVRMPEDMAKKFYNAAKLGTPVIVK